MKIILVNYRYFIVGGVERYFFNIKEILEKKGHEIIPFSIKNSRNFPTDYESYFLDSGGDTVYFSQEKKGIRMIVRLFSRMFYSFEAKCKLKKLLLDTQPDIIYIMQYHNKISPSIIDAAKKMKLPVVHRISDFQYMCPNALFYNDKKGLCEDCLNGSYFNCIKYKCVLNSFIYSLLKLSAKIVHELLRVPKKIDAFIVPSAFTLNRLNKYGISLKRLHHIPTFFPVKNETSVIEYKPFMLFIGRIEKAKGIMTLVKAFVNTDYNLKIIGDSMDRYDDQIKLFLRGEKHNIDFLGRMDFTDIMPYLATCLCVIVPSEWYDNSPNVILESFAFKKAVIATNIGSLPETVENNVTGLTFNYASVESLKEKIEYLFNDPEEAQRMGESAYLHLINTHSAEKHYVSLMNVFNSLSQSSSELHDPSAPN